MTFGRAIALCFLWIIGAFIINEAYDPVLRTDEFHWPLLWAMIAQTAVALGYWFTTAHWTRWMVFLITVGAMISFGIHFFT